MPQCPAEAFRRRPALTPCRRETLPLPGPEAFREDMQAAMDAGMQAHIAKPVDVGALMKELKAVLKRPA